MFIISLTYKVSPQEVEKHLAAHIQFLDKYYHQGVFLLSGKKIPRTGGIILARCDTREQLEKIVDQDPFSEFGVADVEITEFCATKAGNGFDCLLD